MKKKLQTGISDYKDIIESEQYYIDKTLLIEDLRLHGGKATLIPRPRRFGKTTNLSMLRYFYEKSEQPRMHLFEDKKIWAPEYAEARKDFNKYPVISITLKDVKYSSWELTRKGLMDVISAEYERHRFLLDTAIPSEDEKAKYLSILNHTAHDVIYHNALKNLSGYLKQYYSQKVIVLLDEYDTPIHVGFLHGFYPQVVEFMRGLMSRAFKDNDDNLDRGIITGILRTAKEGLFSGLNNLTVFNLLDNFADDKYGFTQEEVDQFLKDYDLSHLRDKIRDWYNGYQIGQARVYNPWSVMQCVKRSGEFQTYWANTSDNELVKKLMIDADEQVKKDFELLLAGKEIPGREMTDKMVFPTMHGDSIAFWNLLLYTGYVTTGSCFYENDRKLCALRLPNLEIRLLFESLINEVFRQALTEPGILGLQQALREADGELLQELLSKFMHAASFHDLPENEAERTYHMFVLGMVTTLHNLYVITSNRESGYGYYDIVLRPKHNKPWPAIVIEFKRKKASESMEQCAARALEQIKQQKYAADLRMEGTTNIVGFGIACFKKEVLVVQEQL